MVGDDGWSAEAAAPAAGGRRSRPRSSRAHPLGGARLGFAPTAEVSVVGQTAWRLPPLGPAAPTADQVGTART